MVEPPRIVRRLEVITGAGGRRRWSDAERARILATAMAPGAVVSAVARRHGMSPQHLFTWLRQARQAASVDAVPLSFVPALVEAPAPDPVSRPTRREARRRRSRAAEVELEIAGAVVRVGPDAGEAQIAAVIRALKATA